MPKVSIIVPVYKVEPYLRRCVESLLAQTYTDFELILVDDGSPDECGRICDEYAEKDKRISVIHKTNGGLASARNAGLDIAEGEFVLFCDSDDYVGPDWCRHLYESACSHPGLLAFGADVIVDPAKPGEYRSTAGSFRNGPCSIPEFFTQNLPGFACSCIFDLRIIQNNGICFPRDVIVEDLPFVLEYLKYMDGMIFSGHTDYFYQVDDRETLSKKYYVDGFRKWREKYGCAAAFIEERISDADRPAVKRALASKYLYSFLQSLDNTFDERNPAGFLKKMKYNQEVVRSWEFQDCLAYADTSREDSRYIWFLKHRMYFPGWSLVQLANMKHKWRR